MKSNIVNYTVKSAFNVGNEFLHVDLIGPKGEAAFHFPLRFADVMQPGTRVCRYCTKGGHDIAWFVNNKMQLVLEYSDSRWARHDWRNMAGLRNGSLDKARFIYALFMAMQTEGVRPTLSIAENMYRLSRAQR